MFASLKILLKKSATWRTVFLTACGVVYLLLGALFFYAAENENEKVSRKKLFLQEKELKQRNNISEIDYNNITQIILELEPLKSGVQWGFTGAFYFAITVVTTIGYGHSVPRTAIGKIICIFYAIFGVPLWLITFQAMGERINSGAKYLFIVIGHKIGFKLDQVTHRCLIPFGIFSCVITILVGIVAFSHFENWSYLNSAYFSVMTLTTIGFGDFVALQDGGALQKSPDYVTFTLTYIMIGLVVIGAFLNLVILRMMVTVPNTPDVSVSGGNKRGSSVAEECEITVRNENQSNRLFLLKDLKYPHKNSFSREKETSFFGNNLVKNGVSYSCCDFSQPSKDGWFLKDSFKKKSGQKLSCQCKTVPCHLCQDCKSEILKFIECSRHLMPSRRCKYANAIELLFGKLNSFEAQSPVGIESSNLSNDNIFVCNSSINLNALASTSTKRTPIPEVLISHIDASQSDSCSEEYENHTNNSKLSIRDSYKFLKPDTSTFKRDRCGSGDSGYRGGFHNSSCNLSQTTSEGESGCCLEMSKSRFDSKADFEINLKPVLIDSSIHDCTVSNFSSAQFKSRKQTLLKPASFSGHDSSDELFANEGSFSSTFLAVECFRNRDHESVNLASLKSLNQSYKQQNNFCTRPVNAAYHSDTDIKYGGNSQGVEAQRNTKKKTI